MEDHRRGRRCLDRTGVIGALIKGLFPILMISAVVFGLYLLYKAVSGSDNNTVSKL